MAHRRTVEQEIRQLKSFLNDKISSINEMKEELQYKDIDTNTIQGVRNANELGKLCSYLHIHTHLPYAYSVVHFGIFNILKKI